jgi:hypothetical protein
MSSVASFLNEANRYARLAEEATTERVRMALLERVREHQSIADELQAIRREAEQIGGYG